MQISLFKNVSTPAPLAIIELNDFLLDVKNGRWASEAKGVREGKIDKKKLPAVTISGIFSNRNQNNLLKHSGFICIDVDEQVPPETLELLRKDEYIYSFFRTISGNGLAIIFRVEPDKHSESYDYLSSYLLANYALVSDPAPKSVASLRIISYDPELYLNINAPVVQVIQSEIEQSSVNTAYARGNKINLQGVIEKIIEQKKNITDSYHDYLYVGFALAEELGEQGRRWFHELSKLSEKYTQSHCDKQYDYCLARRGKLGKKISIATLFYLAKKAGIDLPKANEASTSKTQQEIIESLVEWIKGNYSLRQNAATGSVELNNENIKKESINTIYLTARSHFNSGKITKDLVESVIYSHYIEKYNPFEEYIKEANARNYLVDELVDTIVNIKDHERVFIKRWLAGIAAAMHGEAVRLVLVLVGRQNTGKSEWFRRLLPAELQRYYAESTLDQKKDSELLMAQKLIIMNDEFGGMTRDDERRFKYLTTANYFSLRAPFGRSNEDYKRLAVLCGTSNEMQIISDATGNTRVLPVMVDAINHEKYNSINKRDLLLDAIALYKSGYSWQLTADEVQLLSDESEKYRDMQIELELLHKFFAPNGNDRLTSAEIKQLIEAYSGQKIINLRRFGQALVRFFGQSEVMKKNGLSLRVYRCEFLHDKGSNNKDEEIPF